MTDELIIALYTSVPELEKQEKYFEKVVKDCIKAKDYKQVNGYERLLRVIRERLAVLKS